VSSGEQAVASGVGYIRTFRHVQIRLQSVWASRISPRSLEEIEFRRKVQKKCSEEIYSLSPGNPTIGRCLSSVRVTTVLRYLWNGTEAWSGKYRVPWNDGTIDRHTPVQQNRNCDRELIAASGAVNCSCVPLCCSRAQHDDGKFRTASDYVSLHPHARAAGTPTGRSPFPAASIQIQGISLRSLVQAKRCDSA